MASMVYSDKIIQKSVEKYIVEKTIIPIGSETNISVELPDTGYTNVKIYQGDYLVWNIDLYSNDIPISMFGIIYNSGAGFYEMYEVEMNEFEYFEYDKICHFSFNCEYIESIYEQVEPTNTLYFEFS